MTRSLSWTTERIVVLTPRPALTINCKSNYERPQKRSMPETKQTTTKTWKKSKSPVQISSSKTKSTRKQGSTESARPTHWQRPCMRAGTCRHSTYTITTISISIRIWGASRESRNRSRIRGRNSRSILCRFNRISSQPLMNSNHGLSR